MLIVGVVLEAWVVNSLSTYSDKLSELEAKKAQLQLSNQLIKNEIAAEGGLNLVDQRAKSVGFEPIKSLEYISDETQNY